MSVFLHGGGDHPDWRASALGPFVRAAQGHSAGPLALVVAEATDAEARESFQAYGAMFESFAISLVPVLVSPDWPLLRAALEAVQPSGVFVCGGATPLYHQCLCTDSEWLGYLRATEIPYGGTSAGAAIAASLAILGGWRAQRGNVVRPILFQGAGEGLDLLTMQPGLGLVPFAVEVHASQMGTLTRLIHAVELGFVNEGWAIDENTLLQVTGDKLQVSGSGYVYHVRRAEGHALTVTIHTAD